MQHVAANITAARKAKGHTQRSLALALGLAERTVQGWEQREALPTRRNLEALARLLGREPAWFYAVHDDTPVAA